MFFSVEETLEGCRWLTYFIVFCTYWYSNERRKQIMWADRPEKTGGKVCVRLTVKYNAILF